ncbi:MAG: PLP-dependent aminotransferase family protein [Halopseudomonas aestusnigri]
MAKETGHGLPLPFLNLHHNVDSPLYMQIVQQLRKMVLGGELKAGQRLPATRVMMRELGVSRSTVIAAFEQLVAEGYFTSTVGKGTFVDMNVQPTKMNENSLNLEKNKVVGYSSSSISKRGKTIISNFSSSEFHPTVPRAFAPNVPAIDLFPYKTWSRIENKVRNSKRRDLMTYGDPGGYFPLREAVSEYVYSYRGIRCDPRQVIITTGTQRSLLLVTSLLSDVGDKVLIEDPASNIVQQSFRSQGATLCPLLVDADGIDANQLSSKNMSAKLAYMTPSCQYPMGVTMPVARRLDWLNWANQNAAWIIEDDEDCEFRFLKRSIPAMASLDQNNRVIYTWSLSNILFPALRLGIMIVPPELIEPFETANGLIDRGPNSWMQAVLFEFIQGGYLASHTRQMRNEYSRRREVLLHELSRNANGLIEPIKTESGLRIIASLSNELCDLEVENKLNQNGISSYALSSYCQKRKDLNGLLLGFSCVPEQEIPKSVNILMSTLRSLRGERN